MADKNKEELLTKLFRLKVHVDTTDMANDGYIIVGVSDIPKDAFDNADQEAKLKQTVRSRVIEMLQAKTFIELASLDMCETIVLNTRYIQQFRILSIEQFEAKDN